MFIYSKIFFEECMRITCADCGCLPEDCRNSRSPSV